MSKWLKIGTKTWYESFPIFCQSLPESRAVDEGYWLDQGLHGTDDKNAFPVGGSHAGGSRVEQDGHTEHQHDADDDE